MMKCVPELQMIRWMRMKDEEEREMMRDGKRQETEREGKG